MNEMELLSQLRDEVPWAGITPGAEDRFVTALRADQPGRPAGPRRRPAGPGRGRPGFRGRREAWRLAIIGPVVAGLAAGVTTAFLPSGNQPASGAGRAALTAKVLAARAAAAALSGPSVKPGQWVYRKTVGIPPLLASGPTETLEAWATADDTREAFISAGKIFVGGSITYPWPSGEPEIWKFPEPHYVSYRSLGSLPADPRALVSRLGDTYTGGSAAYRDSRAFEIIADILYNYVLSPALTAELYRALGDIPGVQVVRNVTDLAGQRGIAFRYPAAPGVRSDQEIIVSPSSYQFMAWELLDRAGGTAGFAILREAFVPGPGVRP